MIYNIKVLANNPSFDFGIFIDEANKTILDWSDGRLGLSYTITKTHFQEYPISFFTRFQDKPNSSDQTFDINSINTHWYRDNLTPLAGDADVTVFLDEQYKGHVQIGLFSWADRYKAFRIELKVSENDEVFKNNNGYYVTTKHLLHELSHNFYYLTKQSDETHYFEYSTPQGLSGAYQNLNYDILKSSLAKHRLQLQSLKQPSMNQVKIVKSKNSKTVYLCYPTPSMQHLEERSNLEGFEIPSDIPNSDSL